MRSFLLLSVLVCLGAADYPCWRGLDGSGLVDSGSSLVTDVAQARLAWVSADPIPVAGWDVTSIGCSGGLNNPVLADGRIYLTYYEMSGEVVASNWQDMFAKDRRQKAVWPDEAFFRKRWLVGADDVIHCFDAATGKTLWRKVFKDQAVNYNHRGPGLKTGPHMTPCVAEGRLYATGALMALYCLDAKTGEVIWQNPMPADCKKLRDDALAAQKVIDMRHRFCNVHLQCVDGILIVPTADSALTGYDTQTGKQVWSQPKATGGTGIGPVRWTTGGRTLLINGRTCLDPKDGKVLWTAPGTQDAYSVPAVSGDRMVCAGKPAAGDSGKGADGEGSSSETLQGFAIDAQKAELRWNHVLDGRQVVNGASPVIWRGKAYVHAATDRGKSHYLYAIDLTTGTTASIAEVTDPVYNPVYDSLTGGDGLLMKVVNRVPHGVGVFSAEPAGTRYLGRLDEKERYGWCSTGIYADGCFYFRRWERLVCYDLRRR
jgi:outer membrane protein assembly factor BamB